jgi:hypothetical protein
MKIQNREPKVGDRVRICVNAINSPLPWKGFVPAYVEMQVSTVKDVRGDGSIRVKYFGWPVYSWISA